MPSNPAYSTGGRSGMTKSTHSLASTAQTNKTIQQEYQEYKVRKKVVSVTQGSSRLPFKLGIGFVVGGLLLLGVGIGLLAAWLEGRLILDDKQSFVGPLIAILGLVCLGVAGWFFYDARRKREKDRKQLTYRAEGTARVAVVDKRVKSAQSKENLKSGTYSSRAIGSTPDHSLRTGPTASVHSSRHSMASKQSLPSLDGRGDRSRNPSTTGSISSETRGYAVNSNPQRY
ncbi:uncharacterized protein LOC135484205 [Lineus longissimus]|uniref:uncharacterized protein LOC135484205 n=1 Tax=Lineus longissimus TaxID=88925 RepID=UPI00315D0CB5